MHEADLADQLGHGVGCPPAVEGGVHVNVDSDVTDAGIEVALSVGAGGRPRLRVGEHFEDVPFGQGFLLESVGPAFADALHPFTRRDRLPCRLVALSLPTPDLQFGERIVDRTRQCQRTGHVTPVGGCVRLLHALDGNPTVGFQKRAQGPLDGRERIVSPRGGVGHVYMADVLSALFPRLGDAAFLSGEERGMFFGRGEAIRSDREKVVRVFRPVRGGSRIGGRQNVVQVVKYAECAIHYRPTKVKTLPGVGPREGCVIGWQTDILTKALPTALGYTVADAGLPTRSASILLSCSPPMPMTTTYHPQAVWLWFIICAWWKNAHSSRDFLLSTGNGIGTRYFLNVPLRTTPCVTINEQGEVIEAK